MTRKDFEAIAAALADQRPIKVAGYGGDEQLGRVAQWRSDVLAIAETLSDLSGYTPNGNRRFDRERFMKAVTK